MARRKTKLMRHIIASAGVMLVVGAVALPAMAQHGEPTDDPPAASGEDEGGHGAHPIGLSAEAINWADFAYTESAEEYAAQHGVHIGPPVVALFINFLLLAGIIFFLARKPVSKALQERSDKVRDDLASAQKMLEEANEQLADYSARLERMDDEMKRLREEFIAAGVAERDRLVADGSAKADRLRSDAKVRIEQELNQLRENLRVEIVEKAVAAATEQLTKKVSPADQRRLADEYASRIEQGGLGQ